MRTRTEITLLVVLSVFISSASAAIDVKVADVQVANATAIDKKQPSPSLRPSFRRHLQVVNQTVLTNAPTNQLGLPATPSFFPTSAPTTVTYLSLSRGDFIQACIIGGSALLGLALLLSQWNRYKKRGNGKGKRFAPARNHGGRVQGGKNGLDSDGPGPLPAKVFINGTSSGDGNNGSNGEYDSRSVSDEGDYFNSGSGAYGGFTENDDPIRRTAADTGIQSMLAAKAKSNRTTQAGSDHRYTVGQARAGWKSKVATPAHAGTGDLNPEMEQSTDRRSIREAVDSVFSRLNFPSARMIYQSTLGSAQSNKRENSGGSGDKRMAPDRASYMPRQTTSRTSVGVAATSGYQQSLMKKKASMAPPKHNEGRVKRNDWRRSDAPSSLLNTPRRTHNGRYKTRARTLQNGGKGNQRSPSTSL